MMIVKTIIMASREKAYHAVYESYRSALRFEIALSSSVQDDKLLNDELFSNMNFSIRKKEWFESLVVMYYQWYER